jgi:hypothetical protein
MTITVARIVRHHNGERSTGMRSAGDQFGRDAAPPQRAASNKPARNPSIIQPVTVVATPRAAGKQCPACRDGMSDGAGRGVNRRRPTIGAWVQTSVRCRYPPIWHQIRGAISQAEPGTQCRPGWRLRSCRHQPPVQVSPSAPSCRRVETEAGGRVPRVCEPPRSDSLPGDPPPGHDDQETSAASTA